MSQNISEVVEIRRGVEQWCTLFQLIFNIYSEFLFKEPLDRIDGRIEVNRVNINNLRNADDMVLFATNQEDLQLFINKVAVTCDKF